MWLIYTRYLLLFFLLLIFSIQDYFNFSISNKILFLGYLIEILFWLIFPLKITLDIFILFFLIIAILISLRIRNIIGGGDFKVFCLTIFYLDYTIDITIFSISFFGMHDLFEFFLFYHHLWNQVLVYPCL